ncbi:hypothetical protein I4U23_003323 [Adineta vaga]|nr:hypothetical protein I4U23_003323 [Adineta vaga]
MYTQHSLESYNYAHQSSPSSDLYRKSIYSKLKRPSYDDEQIVKSEFVDNLNRSSTSSSPLIKMQHQTTNDPSPGVASRLCSVCGDISTGIHFGGNSCESCKAFFRRSVQCNRHQNYKCSNEEQCPVNIVTRKVCQYCRYIKCTVIGMKPKWVLTDQERAEKYGSRRKRFRENRPTDEDPDIYKYFLKDEKLLIEDIAHALYQSRATYPLQFPPELNQYLTLLASGKAPPSPASPGEKPPSPSANFLIVPIQRFVLFARMLKDFDLFSEDDKVNLLKGAAIEVVVCSSNTLFNSKTHTFTNYLSRDQRAVMDDQIMPLDPLLKKLWGEEIFNRTKTFLISMSDLHVDEVTSTLLIPVILFSPDRSNIKDLDLVKRLQIKYVALIHKYIKWRYGAQHAEKLYPKLLLQIVNVRALGLAHAEIIQKVMATTNVNPLVQEVTNKPTTDRTRDSASFPSTPSGSEMMDYDKVASMDTESTVGSDDDDSVRNKTRSSMDDERDYDTEDFSQSSPRNIWRKRRKLSSIPQEEPIKFDPDALPKPIQYIKEEFTRSNSADFEACSNATRTSKRPHDHQVPNFIPTIYHNDINLSHKSSSLRHLPPKKQSLSKRNHLTEQIYHPHSSSTNDLTSYEHHQARSHHFTDSPSSVQNHHDTSFEGYQQQYLSYQQQQQNEQHLLLLSLANTRQASVDSLQSQPTKALKSDEQELLNAIHAHPNKRDLVLNLLRQMNESSLPPVHPSGDPNYHQQQQSESHSNYNSY